MPMIIPPLPPGARTTPRRRVDVSHKQLGGSHPDHSLPPEESVLRKEWIPDDRFVVGTPMISLQQREESTRHRWWRASRLTPGKECGYGKTGVRLFRISRC